MKISSKKYAIALYDVVSKATKDERPQVVENFFNLLLKKNVLSLLPLIIEELDKYIDQQSGQIRAELFTAHPATKTTINELRQFLMDNLQKKVVLYEHLDKNLLGGFTLKWHDFLLDASVKAELSRLNRQLSL